MKKIKCDFDSDEYVKVRPPINGRITLVLKSESAHIAIGAEKIRKLRKQLKKALLQIKGVKEDKKENWFSPGKKVVITDNSSSHDFPIGTVVIVRENELNDERTTHCEYLDGHDYFFVRPSDCEPYKEDEA